VRRRRDVNSLASLTENKRGRGCEVGEEGGGRGGRGRRGGGEREGEEGEEVEGGRRRQKEAKGGEKTHQEVFSDLRDKQYPQNRCIGIHPSVQNGQKNRHSRN
jgi:hypothetical protein